MEMGSGTIKQLVKREEYANGGINLTIDSKINVWSSNPSKIDNIFALVYFMILYSSYYIAFIAALIASLILIASFLAHSANSNSLFSFL